MQKSPVFQGFFISGIQDISQNRASLAWFIARNCQSSTVKCGAASRGGVLLLAVEFAFDSYYRILALEKF
jgi:hypothetical protein